MSGLKNLFKAPKPLPQIKVVKQAAETGRKVALPSAADSDLISAARRTRQAARARRGRLSTILTDQTQDITGATGKLGA